MTILCKSGFGHAGILITSQSVYRAPPKGLCLRSDLWDIQPPPSPHKCGHCKTGVKMNGAIVPMILNKMVLDLTPESKDQFPV